MKRKAKIYQALLTGQMLALWWMFDSKVDNSLFIAGLWTLLLDSMIGRILCERAEKGERLYKVDWGIGSFKRHTLSTFNAGAVGLFTYFKLKGVDPSVWVSQVGPILAIPYLALADSVLKNGNKVEVFGNGVKVMGRFVAWDNVERFESESGYQIILHTGQWPFGGESITIDEKEGVELEKIKERYMHSKNSLSCSKAEQSSQKGGGER